MTQEPEAPEGRPVRPKRDISPGMIVAVIVVILAVVFIFQNTARSSAKFLWLDLEAPTWVWFFILFLVGVAAGWLGHIVRTRRHARTD